MSTIYVKISGIEGESTHKDYSKQIECLALRHAVSLPVVAAQIRVEGDARQGPVILYHRPDKASPILKQDVLLGTNVGTVTITRMRSIAGASRPIETISLQNAYVVRVDVDTLPDEKTLELSDEVMESFHLEYSGIQWTYQTWKGSVKGGTVSGSWNWTAA